MRENLRDLLVDAGCDVVTARDGVEALSMLRSGGRLPCLIVLDLMMPAMNGYKFRALQLGDPALASIPVVVLTVHDQPPRLDTEVIRKVPFQSDRLLARCAEKLRRSSRVRASNGDDPDDARGAFSNGNDAPRSAGGGGCWSNS
jgi:CheY-like chemotaxis protein